MTELNRYIKDLCLKEGKKSQVSRGDVKEILSLIAKELAKDLYEAGYRDGNNYPGYSFGLIRALTPGIHKELKRLEKVDKITNKLINKTKAV